MLHGQLRGWRKQAQHKDADGPAGQRKKLILPSGHTCGPTVRYVPVR